MDKRVKKLWIKALRSGKYRKGIGCLKQTDDSKHCKYCCLGVLTDLYCKENKLSKEDRNNMLDNNRLLPDKVMEWARLPDNDPDLFYDYCEFMHSSYCNDDLNLSFNKIADLIEENL